MKYIIFCDPHLAPDSTVSNYSGELEEVFNIADRLKVDRIISVGDVYETWQSDKKMTERERYEMINARYPYLTSLIKSRCINVAGNHDWILNSILGYPEEIELKDSGLKIGILHGHRFDSANKNGSKIGKIVSGMWTGLEKMFGASKAYKIQSFFYNLKIKGKKSATELEDSDYIEKAFEYAKSKSWDIIINGHTHSLKMIQRDSGLLLNAGSFTDGKKNLIYLEINDTGIIYKDISI